MRMYEQTLLAVRIAEECGKLLAGKDMLVQATAILDLHATFLSGFVCPVERKDAFEHHMQSVMRVCELKIEERDGDAATAN